MYRWQIEDWRLLQALQAKWPHALLLHGQAGIGKVDFACYLAQALLCEALTSEPTLKQPCGGCVACRWFIQGNHPDYRLVCPESLVNNPTADANDDAGMLDDKKTRAKNTDIKIEQIRALRNFCTLGAHRGGARVVLLYPAEALHAAAANALLKMLEEPPAGVIFVLVCTRIDRLLPTIISRCYRQPLRSPMRADALAWLAEQGVDDTAGVLAQAGGAPLAALSIAHTGNTALRHFILDQLAAGACCDAFACSERGRKAPVPLVLGWLQRWLYDLAAQRAVNRPRYYPAAAGALARCAAQLAPLRLARYTRMVNLRRAVEYHPLNARLMFEELFLAYRTIFVG